MIYAREHWKAGTGQARLEGESHEGGPFEWGTVPSDRLRQWVVNLRLPWPFRGKSARRPDTSDGRASPPRPGYGVVEVEPGTNPLQLGVALAATNPFGSAFMYQAHATGLPLPKSVLKFSETAKIPLPL